MKTLMFTSPTCGPCKQMKIDLAAMGIGSEITPVDVSRPENADCRCPFFMGVQTRFQPKNADCAFSKVKKTPVLVAASRV